MSLSSDVIILRHSSYIVDVNVGISYQDPTLLPFFWEELLRLYFTSFHLTHPLFSLQNFGMNKKYWVRTNLIYCLVYEFSAMKSPIVSVKMKQLLKVSEYYLNRSTPSLISIQCYMLLYFLYRNTGDLKKKKLYLHNAIKISHLIGLPNKPKRAGSQCQYDRALCYTKLIQLYWINLQYSTDMGLLLEYVDIKPKFSLEWQLTDPINSTEVDIAVASNITLNIKFGYLSQIYISSPFVDNVRKEKVDTRVIVQLEAKLNEMYSSVTKKLMPGPYSNIIFNLIKIYYLMVKHQLNSALLKESKDNRLQTNYIELIFDLIKEVSNSQSIITGYLIFIHAILQSVIKLKRYISEEYYGKISEIISIMTNMINYSKNFKLTGNN
jgi:hypothetical protein